MPRSRQTWYVVTVNHDDPVVPSEFTNIEELRHFLARKPDGVQAVIFTSKPVPFEVDREPTVIVGSPRQRRRSQPTTTSKPRARRNGSPTVGSVLDERAE